MTQNESGETTDVSESPEGILVEVQVPALTPEQLEHVEQAMRIGYRLGEWQRHRSCVAVGYEMSTVRRMRVKKDGDDSSVLPVGCRHTTPYELAMYVEQNPGLHGYKGMGCYGEYWKSCDHWVGKVTDYLMYVGERDCFEQVTFYMHGFPPGTGILYVEL